MFVITPENHAEFPANEGGLVRAYYPATLKLTKLDTQETKVDYLMQLDVGGNEKSGIVMYFLNLYLHKNLKRVVEMQQYFQKLRPLNVLDKDDGIAMAEALVSKYSKKEKQEAMESKSNIAHIRVHSVFSSHIALKQYSEENPRNWNRL